MTFKHYPLLFLFTTCLFNKAAYALACQQYEMCRLPLNAEVIEIPVQISDNRNHANICGLKQLDYNSKLSIHIKIFSDTENGYIFDTRQLEINDKIIANGITIIGNFRGNNSNLGHIYIQNLTLNPGLVWCYPI